MADQILEILGDLSKKKFEKFVFYLNVEVVEGCKPIQWSDLEGKSRTDIARLMNNHYGNQMVKITLKILEKIDENNLYRRLENNLIKGLTSGTEQTGVGATQTDSLHQNLQKGTNASIKRAQLALKTQLMNKYEFIFEGFAKPGYHALLNDIYTELYITEGGSGGINNEHEIRQLETASMRQTTEETAICYNDIFKPSPGQKKHIRTVFTKGIAGIGKTISVHKFILDWAEGKANQDIDFIFPLPFRGLNLKKEKEFSLMQLLQHYFPRLKEIENIEDEEVSVVFILDGLDECRLPLDFQSNEVYDITETSSVDLLITNLIQGNLLPSALLWITSRPAATNRIPPGCIHLVTEVRGFNDPQKEEYFTKRIKDQNQARRVIEHIKSSRSLYIMCHIPVFCWISATILETMVDKAGSGDLPTSLTELYTRFLLIQTHLKNQKYHGVIETNSKKMSAEDTEIILKLGKLAFQQLEKGDLIFYEEDLEECGVDVNDPSLYSEVCTEIFKEECGLDQEKVYCFVHLSVQEYLAALFAFHSCVNENINVLRAESKPHSDRVQLSELLMAAVDQALESKNGHLDLFLRFLLGLSWDSIYTHLAAPLTKSRRNSAGTLCERQQTQAGSTSPGPDPQLQSRSPQQDPQTQNGSRSSVQDSPMPRKRRSDRRSFKKSFVQFFQRIMRRKSRACEPDPRTGCRSTEPEPQTESRSTEPEPQTESRSTEPEPQKGSRFTEPEPQTECRSTEPGPQTESRSSEPEPQTESRFESTQKTIEHIKRRIRGESSAERIINLFHCLQELNDNFIVEELPRSFTTAQVSNRRLEPDQCSAAAFVLLMSEEIVDVFDLKAYNTSAAGHQRLVPVVRNCRKAILNSCDLTKTSCEIVVSVLQTKSLLTDVDLSYNNLGDSKVELLRAGLMSPNCKLQSLGLNSCDLTEKSCKIVAAVLQSNSLLTDLSLSFNNLGNSGVGCLLAGLMSPNCKLQRLGLGWCNLTEGSCGILASVLRSPHSELRDLELRDNELQDSGVRTLSTGLEDPHCKLQRLGLSGCCVTQSGCDSLAAALRSNPSHLRELDLRYNHPGDSGVRELSDVKLDALTILVDHAGEKMTEPGPRKYGCHLTLDPSTASKDLSLSDGNRTVTHIDGEYPASFMVEIFPDNVPQVESKESVCERCFWEVEFSIHVDETSKVFIALSYERENSDWGFGLDKSSWSLSCSHDRGSKGDEYHAIHNGNVIYIPISPSPYRRAGKSKRKSVYRVGVFVDRVAGALSFYSVSDSDTLTLLHRFHADFPEHTPLLAGFGVQNSSASLCQMY